MSYKKNLPLYKDKKGSPILEELLLIGVAIIIFVIVYAFLSKMISWVTDTFKNVFG